MDYERLADVLPKFIGRELLPQCGDDRALTVTDFRLEIRNQNLTELRDWSSSDLDLMEVHAARFNADAPLDCVLELPSGGQSESPFTDFPAVCSPSPFAWT